MKPHRIRMTHNLLLNYGLYRKMEIYVSLGHQLCGETDMFMSPEIPLACVQLDMQAWRIKTFVIAQSLHSIIRRHMGTEDNNYR